MSKIKISCLGPSGTHSQAACNFLFKGANIELYPTINEAINALYQQKVDICFVPIENSLEGSINITLDSLSNSDFCIVSELIWSIRHHLLVKNTSSNIKTITSHPQALAQCQTNIKIFYPQALIKESQSTSQAAMLASKNEDIAALSSLEAAKIYNLSIAKYDMQDSNINSTRFVVIKPTAFVRTEKNAAKTSIVCELDGEKSGTLCELLKEFAKRNINLVRIESRPAKTMLGRYIFFLDLQGSFSDKNVKEALQAIKHQCLWVKILGSYPVFTT